MASLTRHLYRFEEVRAAFLYCIKCRRRLEAIFWLTELEESCYGGEARRLLFVAWFLFVGVRRVSWLHSWAQVSSTREGRLELAVALARCSERDSSLWLLLWAGCLVEPLGPTTGSLVCQWRSLFDKEDDVVWTKLLSSSTDERLDTCLEALQEDMRGYATLAKVAGCCLCGIQGKWPKGTWEGAAKRRNEDVEKALAEWSAEKSLRRRRVYSIPYDCLFGMTWRGLGGNTGPELLGLGEAQFKSSPWWKKVLPTEGLDDDSAKEGFWDTYFHWVTCDHPDEWSKADRAKSHGEGVSGTLSPLWRWWRNWICPEHLYIWGRDFDAIQIFVKSARADVDASVLDQVLREYGSRNLTVWNSGAKHKKVFHLIE
jgi:hypothetical protein